MKLVSHYVLLTALYGVIISASAEELGEGNPVSQYTDYILPTVEVVGTTPLEGARLPMSKLSGNYQTADSVDIYRHESLDMTDMMNKSMSSVSVNSVLGNPLQPDVNYRGFTASSLLGTPAGISVYQDGVRINNPFGDTVNWDLIPRSAIANIELIPGSNPIFGLNTLGGALAVRTKSGVSHPGTRGQAYGGSFGRNGVEIEHGGSYNNFDWFVTGNLFGENGFRDYSPSSVKQGFAKIGWEDDKTDIDLSYTYVENKLAGNGSAPVSMMAQNIAAVYVHPETTQPVMNFVNFSLSHIFSKHWTISGNGYYRQNNIWVNSGDLQLDAQDNFDQTPVINNTYTNQQGVGGAFQLSYLGNLFNLENQTIWGASYDSGDTHFSQWQQNATVTSTREVVATGGLPRQLTDLQANNRYYGLYMTDTLSVTPWLHLTAAARWNKALIDLNGSGTNPTTQVVQPLQGNHQFDHLNPAAGFTLQPLKALAVDNAFKDLTFFANYSQGFRVPTPVELNCADPAAPCALPTNFASDPSLRPVLSETWETGFRGKINQYLNWNIAYYRTALENDILFINAPNSTINGYFTNVPNTLRQGLELGLRGKAEKFSWFANYTFLDATYQSDISLRNALGPVAVHTGNHIPSLSPHLVKLGTDYEILDNWVMGGTLLYNASQYLQGDYNNSQSQVNGYVTVNLNTHYDITKNFQVFALANNIFDERFYNYGVVNRNGYNAGSPEAFVTPGAPISGWAGIRVKFD